MTLRSHVCRRHDLRQLPARAQEIRLVERVCRPLRGCDTPPNWHASQRNVLDKQVLADSSGQRLIKHPSTCSALCVVRKLTTVSRGGCAADAKRDFSDIGASKVPIASLPKCDYGEHVTEKDDPEQTRFEKGVLFCTYTCLIAGRRPRARSPKQANEQRSPTLQRSCPAISSLRIPVIGFIARGTQRLNCSMRGPWSRA